MPREKWPQKWHDEGYIRPVVPLRLALYGHPNSGSYWERHCEKHLKDVGFEEVPDWRSCFWHAELKVLLVVYVDDYMLSGPAEAM